jgi:hypothetical protein
MVDESTNEMKDAQFPVAGDKKCLDWGSNNGGGENVYRNGLPVEHHNGLNMSGV